jgi:hypothetical protein
VGHGTDCARNVRAAFLTKEASSQGETRNRGELAARPRQNAFKKLFIRRGPQIACCLTDVDHLAQAVVAMARPSMNDSDG